MESLFFAFFDGARDAVWGWFKGLGQFRDYRVYDSDSVRWMNGKELDWLVSSQGLSKKGVRLKGQSALWVKEDANGIEQGRYRVDRYGNPPDEDDWSA